MPRRDTIRVSNADVDVGAPVAATDRAVVLGASRWHREARTLFACFAALCNLGVVAYEARIALRARSAAALSGGAIRVA